MAKRSSIPRSARGRERWMAIVADLERSGLSVASYSQTHRLSARTLSWWRWALKARPEGGPQMPRRKVARRAKRPTMSFVPVRVVADPVAEPEAVLHVVLTGGRRVEVSPGFDGETLERLLLVLEAMPC